MTFLSAILSVILSIVLIAWIEWWSLAVIIPIAIVWFLYIATSIKDAAHSRNQEENH